VIGEDGFDLRVESCFAFDNVTRAGFAGQYECGILPRLIGWFEELKLDCDLTPAPGKCLKARGEACVYSFRNVCPGVGRVRTE
jgi:hypothetical protein